MFVLLIHQRVAALILGLQTFFAYCFLLNTNSDDDETIT